MIEARRQMLIDALEELMGPAVVWRIGAQDAPPPGDLAELLALEPRLTLRQLPEHDTDQILAGSRYPVFGMSLPEEGAPRGNRFVGFPSGFSLDAFIDELVALTRGASLSSPLARETLARLSRPVRIRVYTTPG